MFVREKNAEKNTQKDILGNFSLLYQLFLRESKQI
jgi:hypothetical protein